MINNFHSRLSAQPVSVILGSALFFASCAGISQQSYECGSLGSLVINDAPNGVSIGRNGDIIKPTMSTNSDGTRLYEFKAVDGAYTLNQAPSGTTLSKMTDSGNMQQSCVAKS